MRGQSPRAREPGAGSEETGQVGFGDQVESQQSIRLSQLWMAGWSRGTQETVQQRVLGKQAVVVPPRMDEVPQGGVQGEKRDDLG